MPEKILDYHFCWRYVKKSVLPDLVEMPDLTCPLMAHHAGSDRRARRADLPEQLAVSWLSHPPQDLITAACGMFAHFFVDEPELFLCIVLHKLFF